MSKRSLGSKHAQKKGNEIHRKERERHREKMRRKYAQYCTEIEKENKPGLLPAPYDVWITWYNANAKQSKDKSLSGILTDLVNEMGEEEESNDVQPDE